MVFLGKVQSKNSKIALKTYQHLTLLDKKYFRFYTTVCTFKSSNCFIFTRVNFFAENFVMRMILTQYPYFTEEYCLNILSTSVCLTLCLAFVYGIRLDLHCTICIYCMCMMRTAPLQLYSFMNWFS